MATLFPKAHTVHASCNTALASCTIHTAWLPNSRQQSLHTCRRQRRHQSCRVPPWHRPCLQLPDTRCRRNGCARRWAPEAATPTFSQRCIARICVYCIISPCHCRRVPIQLQVPTGPAAIPYMLAGRSIDSAKSHLWLSILSSHCKGCTHEQNVLAAMLGSAIPWGTCKQQAHTRARTTCTHS